MPSPLGAHRVPQEQQDYHAAQRDKSSSSKPLSRLPIGRGYLLLKRNVGLENQQPHHVEKKPIKSPLTLGAHRVLREGTNQHADQSSESG